MNTAEINHKFKEFLKEESLNLNNLVPKPNLHSDFWDKMSFNDLAQNKLMKIANDVMGKLKISEFIEDIILTGSIASFNWHSLSDIDLHFIFDFNSIDKNKELVKRMLDLTRMKWNKDHKITIFGHEVEIYFQDSNETHESSGVYSILRREWIESPTVTPYKPDNSAVFVKAMAIIREIDRIQEIFVEKRYQEAHAYTVTLQKKIKNMRMSGLAKEGVFSVENLTFKALRNNEKLGLLSFFRNMSYDKMMSVKKVVKISHKR